MKKLRMDAIVAGVWEKLSDSQLQAVADDLTYGKPRFCVRLLLAVLDKKNGNGHYLSLAETKKAVAAFGDKQAIPGNFNHQTEDIVATSTKVYIDETGESPLLYLEGVFWNRQLSEESFDNVMELYRAQKLGASWEIDTYRLEAGTDDPSALHVLDYSLDGWALCTDATPAEKATTGAVSITAKLEADKKKLQEIPADVPLTTERRAKRMVAGDIIDTGYYGEMPIAFLNNIPCPACGGYGVVKKIDYENAIFVLECTNGAIEPRHRFEVRITVKMVGQTAEYALIAKEDEYNAVSAGYSPDDIGNTSDMVAVMIRQIKKEVETMEYTEEQIEAMKAKAIKDAVDEQKNSAAAQLAQKETMEKAVAEAIGKEKDKISTDAVEAYKASQVAMAKRIDDAEAILAFASDEEKEKAKIELAAMTEAEFATYIVIRGKDKEIADLTADENPDTDSSGGKLPAGKIQASKDNEITDDAYWASLTRI